MILKACNQKVQLKLFKKWTTLQTNRLNLHLRESTLNREERESERQTFEGISVGEKIR